MLRAAAWWAGTLAIAAGTSFAVERGLAPVPEQTAPALVSIEVPAGWEALPVAATLTGEIVVKPPDDGCSEGWGARRHEARLGPFTVTWSDLLFKGVGAGETGWSATIPERVGACSLPHGPEYPFHPDALRVDEAAGVYVFEGSNFGHREAMAACRRGTVVTAPAYTQTAGRRWGASIATALLVVVLSWLVRTNGGPLAGVHPRSNRPSR
jgi:hypothetical protein